MLMATKPKPSPAVEGYGDEGDKGYDEQSSECYADVKDDYDEGAGGDGGAPMLMAMKPKASPPVGSRWEAYMDRYEAYKKSGFPQSLPRPERRPDLYGLPKGESGSSSDAWRVPGLAKTMLCKFWQDGYCRRGEACTFTHGEQDLQPVPSHFRYTRSLQRERHRGTDTRLPSRRRIRSGARRYN